MPKWSQQSWTMMIVQMHLAERGCCEVDPRSSWEVALRPDEDCRLANGGGGGGGVPVAEVPTRERGEGALREQIPWAERETEAPLHFSVE